MHRLKLEGLSASVIENLKMDAMNQTLRASMGIACIRTMHVEKRRNFVHLHLLQDELDVPLVGRAGVAWRRLRAWPSLKGGASRSVPRTETVLKRRGRRRAFDLAAAMAA